MPLTPNSRPNTAPHRPSQPWTLRSVRRNLPRRALALILLLPNVAMIKIRTDFKNNSYASVCCSRLLLRCSEDSNPLGYKKAHLQEVCFHSHARHKNSREQKRDVLDKVG